MKTVNSSVRLLLELAKPEVAQELSDLNFSIKVNMEALGRELQLKERRAERIDSIARSMEADFVKFVSLIKISDESI